MACEFTCHPPTSCFDVVLYLNFVFTKSRLKSFFLFVQILFLCSGLSHIVFFFWFCETTRTQGDATDEWSTNTWRNTKDKNLNTWCFFQRAQKEAIANYFTNSIILIVSIRKSWFYAKPYTLLIKKNVKSKFVYVNKNISEKYCTCAYHWW